MIFDQEFTTLQFIGGGIVLVFSVLAAVGRKRTAEKDKLEQEKAAAEKASSTTDAEAKVNASLQDNDGDFKRVV